MSVSGLCEICEARSAIDGCDRCGRLVCEDHYDKPSGLCTECLSEFGRRPSEDRQNRDYPDGVDEYRF